MVPHAYHPSLGRPRQEEWESRLSLPIARPCLKDGGWTDRWTEGDEEDSRVPAYQLLTLKCSVIVSNVCSADMHEENRLSELLACPLLLLFSFFPRVTTVDRYVFTKHWIFIFCKLHIYIHCF